VEPIRVLIADDQALLRGGFRLILDAQPDLEVVVRPRTARRRFGSPRSWPRTWY
jgi:DNA-binding NarL/FixJ family response regulator